MINDIMLPLYNIYLSYVSFHLFLFALTCYICSCVLQQQEQKQERQLQPAVVIFFPPYQNENDYYRMFF